MFSRRKLLQRSATALVSTAPVLTSLAPLSALLSPTSSFAQSTKVRVGFMLPYTGTYSQLGLAIENGFHLALNESAGKLGSREVEFFKVDDESDPGKAVENASKLVQRDKVDVIVGTVHSGVQMGILKVARESGVLNLIPNAGVHAATRALCAPNIFRTSFTNSQPCSALGKVMFERGHKKVVWITWKYAAGDEAFEGFKQSYTGAGGTIIKELGLPFPNVEFQALLTEIAALKPDAVACFFAGAGAAKFIRDYAQAGLNGKIPLYGSGFLTEGLLDDATSPAAQGIMTTLHYSDSLDTPRNKEFRLAYAKTFHMQPDVYAVQGYDAGQLLSLGAKAVNGDLSNKKVLFDTMEHAMINSPRGKWSMSKAHNPIQDMYLRVVEGKENKVLGVAAKSVTDSAAGCKMA